MSPTATWLTSLRKNIECFPESQPCGVLLHTATLCFICNYPIGFAALASVLLEDNGNYVIDFKNMQVSAAFPSIANTQMQECAILDPWYLIIVQCTVFRQDHTAGESHLLQVSLINEQVCNSVTILERKISSKTATLTTNLTSVTSSTGKECPLIPHSSQRRQKELCFGV